MVGVVPFDTPCKKVNALSFYSMLEPSHILPDREVYSCLPAAHQPMRSKLFSCSPPHRTQHYLTHTANPGIMDVSKPVGSEIVSVDFCALETDEVRRRSARQITNPTVFDNLGHPVNGGLYDLALGAFLRNLCTTCGLDEKFCPGHQGHIELPVPVYNPLFFNQMYTFLRSACLYCHRLRLNALEVHRYECRLKLIQYGLLEELAELDNMLVAGKLLPHDADADDEDDDDGGAATGSLSEAKRELRQRREEFVDTAVATAISTGRTAASGTHTALVMEERKRTVHEFYRRILSRPKCDNCGMYLPTFRKDGFVKVFENALRDKQITNNRVKGLVRPDMLRPAAQQLQQLQQLPSLKPKLGSKYVLSTEIRNVLRAVFAKEQPMMQKLFNLRPYVGGGSPGQVSADMFFVQALVVPPTRFRLPSKLGDEIHENSQNELLANVLRTALVIRDLNDQISMMQKKNVAGTDDKRIAFNRLMNAFVTIQNDVNAFIDSTKNQNAPAGKVVNPGVKQALEKKEGLFRKHMMGKRVNYAARLVILPDPMLETNEIGVPPVFAVKLTYPEPVTAHNASELRAAVVNGPDKWPGAVLVQNEDGQLVLLVGMTLEQRRAIANQLMTPLSGGSGVVNKKVLRHIKNHDVVVMNRQPTLHKASMMGHKVRVLPGEKTLRLHYANTGAYNADFDGDEMNMHFPQNENAKAEALNLANTDSQYLTPTLGSPLRGLIQDHILAGVWLTSKDLFFLREQYQQLVYGCIRPEDGHTNGHARIRTVAPAVLKPQALWTGKQVITTVLLNITPDGVPGLNLNSTNKVKNEYWGDGLKENAVVFRNGALICGILDKLQYGALQYGLVHLLHEVYGPATAGKALLVLGRLFTNYIMQTAFTCGMDDLRLTDEGNSWRREILQQSVDVGRAAAVEVANLDPAVKGNNPELLKRLEGILRDENTMGVLDAITQSKVNAITLQVVAKCVPGGTMKRFPYNSMQAMALLGAKGSNVNVLQIMCLLGQQALEGRRVPVMVSGKSLPLFKPFETDARAGGYIKGRFYLGIRPQEYYFHCMAGREGLIDTAVKTLRSGYLQRCLTKQLEGVHVGYDNSVRDGDGLVVQFLYGGDAIDTTKQLHMTQFGFCADNYDALLAKYNPGDLTQHLDTDTALLYAKKARKNAKRQADKPHYEQSDKYDPVLLVYNPAKYLGSVLEKFQDELDNFIAANPGMFSKKVGLTEKKFRALMQLKYMRLLVHPGESVGIIASQLIGEPSTQMTLNTFHFAGHGAANVTLGIPRMREIIMTALSAIKTPQMTLPLLEDVSDDTADLFCKSVARVVMLEFIDKVVVTETIGQSGDSNTRLYLVRMQFYTRAEYEEEYDVLQQHLEHVITSQFLTALEAQIAKEVKKQRRAESAPAVGKAAPKINAEIKGNAEFAEEGDDDEPRGKQAVSYDGPDDDEIETMKRAEETLDEEDTNLSRLDDDTDSESEDEKADIAAAAKVEVKGEMSRAARDRQAEVVLAHNLVTRFNFDDNEGAHCEFTMELPGETQKLLMVNIIEEMCRKVVVREVPRIGRCVRPQPDAASGKRILTTEGVNFKAMWEQHDFVDVNGITSNDVAAVLKTYGVEAARQTIVNEINNVFSTYAIVVSLRHLDLIGDMMTREGTYLAFNRQGIDSLTSAFMKMSYETTCQFLTKAVLDGEREDLESPSARIVMGKLLNVGTGSFDVFATMPPTE